jgi:hypothetical protein
MGESSLGKSFLALDFFGKMAPRVLCSSSKNWPVGLSDPAISAALLV